MNTLQKISLSGILILLHLIVFGQTTRDQNGLAIGVQLTSYGPGIKVIKSLNNSFNVHAGMAFFKYQYNQDIEAGDATSHNNQAKLGAISLGADWQFINFMRLSTGLLYNFSEITFDVSPTNPDDKNHGEVSYTLKPNTICPFFTIGFGRNISKNKMVSFGVDLGISYQGAAKIDYVVNGTFEESLLSRWRYNVESGATYYKVYPILNLNLAFRIF
jgi:hypothetical protein